MEMMCDRKGHTVGSELLAGFCFLDLGSKCTSICFMINHCDRFVPFPVWVFYFTTTLESHRIFVSQASKSGCLKSPSGRQKESTCKTSNR